MGLDYYKDLVRRLKMWTFSPPCAMVFTSSEVNIFSDNLNRYTLQICWIGSFILIKNNIIRKILQKSTSHEAPHSTMIGQ